MSENSFIEITSPTQKAEICEKILRALPNWFGVEESIIEYIRDVQTMPFFAAFAQDMPIGFAALKEHNNCTAEVCVMGVLTEYHRQGLGRLLLQRCEQYCRESGRAYLTVKTLDAARPSRSYEKTRNFYLALGFQPLEVFPLYWDADNPCLFLVKHLCV